MLARVLVARTGGRKGIGKNQAVKNQSRGSAKGSGQAVPPTRP